MARRLYVGSLAWATTDQSLKEAFEAVGPVVEAVVLMHRDDPSRSRGFGFVTMENDADADAAIEKFHQNEPVDGRKLIVNDARPQERDSRGGDRGGYDRDRAPRRDFEADNSPRMEESDSTPMPEAAEEADEKDVEDQDTAA
jgi:RNA recognition motif-containing protein